MAGNSKTRERRQRAKEKREGWWEKFDRDLNKIRRTGEMPNHYVGGGQPYTRGRPPSKNT